MFGEGARVIFGGLGGFSGKVLVSPLEDRVTTWGIMLTSAADD